MSNRLEILLLIVIAGENREEYIRLLCTFTPQLVGFVSETNYCLIRKVPCNRLSPFVDGADRQFWYWEMRYEKNGKPETAHEAETG